MLAEYQNKHVFLSEASSTHTLNLILNLISEDILVIDDILMILFSAFPNKINNKESLIKHGVEVLMWEEVKDLDITFKTLNPLSLTPWNSEIICYFLDHNYIDSSAVNIIMQDDEIDRWNKLYNVNNHLEISSSALIDKDVLRILKHVDNYIVPYKTWGSILEKIVGRQLNIIDVVVPFNVIDYSSQKTLEHFISSRTLSKVSNHYKVMVFTKPTGRYSLLKSIKVLSSYLFKHNIVIPHDIKITFSLWGAMDPEIGLIVKVLNNIFRKRKIHIEIQLIQPVSHGQYFLMLYDYDCLILQPRGGFSTAKYFAEKIGKVITISDSLNDLTFKQEYGINTFNSPTLEFAIKMAIESIQLDNSEKITTHSELIKRKHDISFKKLKEYWKSFD